MAAAAVVDTGGGAAGRGLAWSLPILALRPSTSFCSAAPPCSWLLLVFSTSLSFFSTSLTSLTRCFAFISAVFCAVVDVLMLVSASDSRPCDAARGAR
jgi:hypothetical protein